MTGVQTCALPIYDEKSEEGVVQIAVGLGKYIVDGGLSLRFSPYWPKNVLQTSTLDMSLRDTQNKFYALNMNGDIKDISLDEGANLLNLRIRDAEQDNSLKTMVSTYDPQSMMIRDNMFDKGRRVVTFANILRHETFPLAEILKNVLRIGAEEMGRPIEIEFAVDLNARKGKGVFYWLQIRPIVDTKEMQNDDVSEVDITKTLIYSNHALGHGNISGDRKSVV